jgi:hypothetical protein
MITFYFVCEIITFLCYGCVSGGCSKMTNPTAPSVSPEEIKEMIERAAKEPGINDVLALMELSQEADQIEQIRAELASQPLVMQVTGTAGWVW